MVRGCFSNFIGLRLEQVQWGPATRGFSQAGLGLRSTFLDAPAAYLASIGGCAAKCALVDLNFTSPATCPTATGALGAYKASVATAFTLDSALTQSQRAWLLRSACADGNKSWRLLLSLGKRCCSQRQNPEDAPSFLLYLLGLSAWSLRCSSQSCGTGYRFTRSPR